MFTIEDARKIITDFKLDLENIDNHITKQDMYITNMVLKTVQVGTALMLFKYMAVNNVKVIDKDYFTEPKEKDIISMKYRDIMLYHSAYELSRARTFVFAVLDKDSPYFLTKLLVSASYSEKDNKVTFDVLTVDKEIEVPECEDENNRIASYEDAVEWFIKESVKHKSQLDEIRKATDVENNPIGEQD